MQLETRRSLFFTAAFVGIAIGVVVYVNDRDPVAAFAAAVVGTVMLFISNLVTQLVLGNWLRKRRPPPPPRPLPPEASTERPGHALRRRSRRRRRGGASRRQGG